MTKFVFCSATDNKIEIDVDGEVIVSSKDVNVLAEAIAKAEISLIADSVTCSSSIDFCEDEGFEADEAKEILVKAFNLSVPMMCEVA
jgi:hypothetical protein